ncbi:MAG: 4'-phosphopantetheinyl transferase superfamily protein [Flavobacteriales bacterium]|nr:4'-phosphopantetheinyl transferase superfamily protein [Crocinitomicaceae bacterium]NBX80516.1 4'-phosphopantetheinyl transferase superfamily protein [Flavobacteriales bacterium]
MQKSFNSIKTNHEDFVKIFVEQKKKENHPNLIGGEKSFFEKLTIEKRKQEFLQARVIRDQIVDGTEIIYNEDGKPFLKDNSQFISISHSENYIGMVCAPFNIGMDIEEINERVNKIKNRFLNEQEIESFGKDTLSLTIAWTIKEALFKLNDRKGIDFRKELLIKEKINDTYLCQMLELDGWHSVRIKVMQKENLIISYNFEPSILL